MNSFPKLYCVHQKDCDPKKCTALKLKKFNLLNFIHSIKGNKKNAIVLNPFSHIEISHKDRIIISRFGLIVIDCSWNKLDVFHETYMKNPRKLPPFIAANPVNYGVWEKLSTAEALAAALYITKFDDLADLILSKYRWGTQFKVLNKI